MAENNTLDLISFISSYIPRSCREIGRGAYGRVYEINVNGVRCIGKVIHEILKPQNHYKEEDEENVVSIKFTRECELLNNLRHPNIVQCFGIQKLSFGNNHSDALLMEYMHMDLDHCLSMYPDIILPIKLSVLCDVSHGLLHLHSQKPPIVHRDLTASNILLTPDMRAKIANLGMCRMLELKDLLRLTQAPGALAYMPPEALMEEPNYDLKLDIFSFGVVALFVGNQEFPVSYEVNQSTIPPEAMERKEIQLLKRKCWLGKLGSAHPLYQLITKCLQDNPDMRPSTQVLCSDMEELCDQSPWKFENILKSELPDLTRQALEKENKVLHSSVCNMEAKMIATLEEASKCIHEREKDMEDLVKEYTVVQRQLEDAKLELERKLKEIKQEHKCTLLEKELKESLMHREIEERKTGYKLLQIESINKEHEYKQILEHFSSKQAAEITLLQNKMHQMEEQCHNEVQTLQDKVTELEKAKELLQQEKCQTENDCLKLKEEVQTLKKKMTEQKYLFQVQMHQMEEQCHNEVQTFQDKVTELDKAKELLQQEKCQIESDCLKLKEEVQTLKKDKAELVEVKDLLLIQAEEFRADFMRERQDREALAERLSDQDGNARQKQTWLTRKQNPKKKD